MDIIETLNYLTTHIKHKENIMDLLTKIINAYIANVPNIKEIEGLAITIGMSAEYELKFWARWYAWLCFHDCQYVLTSNKDDMRNYTS